jgi:heme exporter protein C
VLLAPPDTVQGDAQRLMYLHVPAAWSAYLCFVLVLVANVRLLFGGGAVHDRLAQAAAEVGVVLTALTLASGALWGRLTWGTWWVWDARVLSTVAMLVVYVAYLGLRAIPPQPERSRVVAASGVLAFAIVPVVHFSVLWWRTLHQPPTVLAPSTAPPIHASMAVALVAAVLAVTVLTGWAVISRIRALAAGAPPAEPAAREEPARVPTVGAVRE